MTDLLSINEILNLYKIAPPYINCDPDALLSVKDFLKFYKKNPIFIYDENCKSIAQNFSEYDSFCFQGRAFPNIENIEKINAFCTEQDIILVALGSGSISDMCKYVAYEKNIDFIIVGTAPSMNGYASKTASIIDVDGRKKSFLSKLPLAIFLDPVLLAKAPERMIRAGIGDLLCRSTCYADLQMANFFFGENAYDDVMEILYSYEKELINRLDGILVANLQDMAFFAEYLLVSGFAMSICGSSAPCSQGEHMIAHAYHYNNSEEGNNFHGEEIAVTTYFTSRLQEYCLEQDIVCKCFHEKSGVIAEEKNRKINIIKNIQDDLKKTWQLRKLDIRLATLRSDQLLDLFNKVGLGVSFHSLGWKENAYFAAIKESILLRERFTFLDVACAMGILEEFCSNHKL